MSNKSHAEKLLSLYPTIAASWPQENQVNKLAPAFIKAKRAFGPALKDKTNPAFRSKYADLGACIDAVEEALLDNGIAFVQETFEDSTGVTVETVFLHESGESMRCGKLHVPASKQDPQGYGSALTYCRRYSLMAACGIAPEDDDGNAATKKPPQRVEQAAPEPQRPSIRHTPTDGPVDVPETRQTLIELGASIAAEKFKGGEKDAAYDLLSEFLKDNEEMLYLQQVLKPHATLRAYIKFRQEAARKHQPEEATQ